MTRKTGTALNYHERKPHVVRAFITCKDDQNLRAIVQKNSELSRFIRCPGLFGADEPEDLKRLGLRSEACLSAHARWGIDGDATLVESSAVGVSQRSAGLFATGTPHEERWVYLVAVFDAPYVTRAAFEDAMVRFADAGFPRDPRFQLRGGDAWLQVI